MCRKYLLVGTLKPSIEVYIIDFDGQLRQIQSYGKKNLFKVKKTWLIHLADLPSEELIPNSIIQLDDQVLVGTRTGRLLTLTLSEDTLSQKYVFSLGDAPLKLFLCDELPLVVGEKQYVIKYRNGYFSFELIDLEVYFCCYLCPIYCQFDYAAAIPNALAVISNDKLLTIERPSGANQGISYISDLVDEKKRRVVEIIPYEEYLICFLERRNKNHVCMVYSLEK